MFRASRLRCALVYRHNDIIVLIIGKPNNVIEQLSLRTPYSRSSFDGMMIEKLSQYAKKRGMVTIDYHAKRELSIVGFAGLC